MKKVLHCIPGALSCMPDIFMDYLEAIRIAGATGIRLFMDSAWPIRMGLEHASPYIIDQWVYDQEMPDWDIHGHLYTPVFRHEWNPAYFDFIEKICTQLKRLDMTLDASLSDYCSWKLPRSYAYYNRTKAFNAWWQLRGEYGGFGAMNPNKDPFWREWIQKIIPFIQATNVDFDVEICNELGWYLGDDTPETAIRWHNFMVDEVMACGVPLERIYLSADETPETIGVYSQMKRCYLCHHGISNPDRFNMIWSGVSPNLLLSNDGGGGDPGNTGPVGIYGRRETGPEQATWIGQKILERDDRGFEFLSHSVDFPGEDAGNGSWGYLGAIEAMAEVFGTKPNKQMTTICVASGILNNPYCPEVETRDFWPWEVPTEVCSIHKKPEPPLPPKPKSCSYYFKRLNFRRWFKCFLRIR